jgi:hypothetical protein
MRSRVARLTIGMIAWIGFGGVAFFLIQLDQQVTERREAWRAFDRGALDAMGTLADARFAQQAYLAEDQDVAFWTPRVATLAATASTGIEQLRQLATSARSPVTLSEAIAQVKAFDTIDERARQYLLAGQAVMAGDLVISEGGQASRAAARLVGRARLEEEQAVEALEADTRRQQTFALGAAGLVGVLTIALLVFFPIAPARAADADVPSLSPSGAPTTSDPVDELRLTDERPAVPAAAPTVEDPARVLSAAAEICTALGRSADLTELAGLLGRSAGLMGASGVIVWIGETPGGDLRPVMAHGYSEQALARMPTIPRAAENAAAAAYRTGMLQVVRAPSKTSPGAIVAPLLSSAGSVGALTAEIDRGNELSESAQALAMLFAAYLASILVPSAAVASDLPHDRVVSA